MGLLQDELPRRWAHVVGVANKASRISCGLPDEDAFALCVSAWLHDIGYAPRLAITGFHPLDGAFYLEQMGVDARICALVALHSSAAAEADMFDCAREIETRQDERSITRDLLWFCDMTVGPDGTSLTFEERMCDIRARYHSDHYVIRALDAGMLERLGAIERAENWIGAHDLADQV
jgi:hypothetical protein